MSQATNRHPSTAEPVQFTVAAGYHNGGDIVQVEGRAGVVESDRTVFAGATVPVYTEGVFDVIAGDKLRFAKGAPVEWDTDHQRVVQYGGDFVLGKAAAAKDYGDRFVTAVLQNAVSERGLNDDTRAEVNDYLRSLSDSAATMAEAARGTGAAE